MTHARIPTVAFVGNPNTGKTTLFNALTGLHQHVGNYPGVTVEVKKGRLRFPGAPIDLIDLPGTYSLAPRSPDEMVAVELILGQKAGEPRPDLIVAIVDASNLERNLYLMTQVLEAQVPVILALNMIDVATGQGLKIDAEKLSANLGVPVVPIQANHGKGIPELHQAIRKALDAPHACQPPAFPAAFEKEVVELERLAPNEPTFLVRRLLLDVGGQAESTLAARHGVALKDAVVAARSRLAQAGCTVPAIEARTRYAWIRAAVTPCVQRPAQRLVTWTDTLDRFLTHKIWGTLIFLGVMFLVFQSIFTWAGPLMDAIKAGQNVLAELVQGAMEPGPLRSLLVSGVIKGVGSVVVFLPQIVILFAFIAVLEDCGYMARAAYLMDRLMSRAGLNGKSFIPLLSSMACAVPGIMSARVIENPRDRLATILVAPLMSCSARLPVYTLLIATFLKPGPDATWRTLAWWLPGLTLFALYLLGLIVAPLVAYLLKSTLLRGETPPFVLEMPLYKLPSLRLVTRRALGSGWMFLRRAGTMILATMIVVWALLYFPSGDDEGRSYDVRIAALAESIEEPLQELEKIDEALKDTAPGADKEVLESRRKKLEEEVEPTRKTLHDLESEWKGRTWLGRFGKWMEPAVRPLGWDWRIGVAAVASFPAREVMVGTLGILFGQGEGDVGDSEYLSSLGSSLQDATWDRQGRKVFNVPVALSVMVFFALCCQCVSTLVAIKRETNSWRWPAFTFVYMSVLAYLGALATYQIGRLFL